MGIHKYVPSRHLDILPVPPILPESRGGDSRSRLWVEDSGLREPSHPETTRLRCAASAVHPKPSCDGEPVGRCRAPLASTRPWSGTYPQSLGKQSIGIGDYPTYSSTHIPNETKCKAPPLSDRRVAIKGVGARQRVYHSLAKKESATAPR